MKKKGFTLIELLAVIVVLAIIALIATPLVLKYIEYSKEKSAKLSAQTYAEAVEKEYVSKLTNNEKIPNKEYTIKELDELGVKVKGDKPEGDSDYVILNNGNVIEYLLTINGYVITYENGKITVESNKDSNSGSNKINAIDHTVTFTVNGEPYEIMSVKDGNSVLQPYNDPVIEGFNFGGWADIDGTPITFPLTPNADTEIIAIDWSLSDLLYDSFGVDKNEYPYIMIDIDDATTGTKSYTYVFFISSFEQGNNNINVTGGLRYGKNYVTYTGVEFSDVENIVKTTASQLSSITPINFAGTNRLGHTRYTNFNCTLGTTHYIFN